MHGELTLSVSTLIAFALVLTRMAGVFAFVPMPIQEVGPGAARVVLAVATTIALFPRWPHLGVEEAGIGLVLKWMIAEVGLGSAIGLMVSFLTEALRIGAQTLALQAGYGYASVVDPLTQADSEVLLVLAQLLSGLLFFTTGMHRYVIMAFANSLDRYPPGAFTLTADLASTVIRLGSNIFSVGLRLALPIVGLLLMTEIALALLGRISTRLQTAMHAFPAKMLLTLVILAGIITITPTLYQAFAAEIFRTIKANFAG